jgi:hypothetical protein
MAGPSGTHPPPWIIQLPFQVEASLWTLISPRLATGALPPAAYLLRMCRQHFRRLLLDALKYKSRGGLQRLLPTLNSEWHLRRG